MHVHPHQHLSVDYSGFALRLVDELEPKSQIFADVFLPSSNKYGLNYSNNCFYNRRVTQLGSSSRAKLLSRGAKTEIFSVFVVKRVK